MVSNLSAARALHSSAVGSSWIGPGAGATTEMLPFGASICDFNFSAQLAQRFEACSSAIAVGDGRHNRFMICGSCVNFAHGQFALPRASALAYARRLSLGRPP